MKKTITLVFLALLPLLASAYDAEVGGIYYYLYTGTKQATVTSGYYTGSVNIPSSVTYNGVTYSVTSIGDRAFEYCSGLTSVTIPNSVTEIGNRAFAGCGLTSVTIPNSVTSIGDYAFYYCSGLTAVTIPNSVTRIRERAFGDCSKLTAVTIPNSVTEIGSYAFASCSSLTELTIPNSVTDIVNGAFAGCSSLTAVTIPNSVTSIGDGAFAYCSGLTDISVESGNTMYDSRDNCNAIIASNTLIVGCKNTVIPNSVTEIGWYAFYGCSSLTEVKVPNSVTEIGSFAFYGCSGLTAVTIPNSVTAIGRYAFDGCSGLTDISVESGNTKYDSRDNCNAIIETASNTLIRGCENTAIPNSVKSIDNYAFSDCSSLTEVTIPNSVTAIGSYAFYKCSGLTELTIPNSVTTIGSYAFAGCSGLTDVYCYAEKVPSTNSYAFYGWPEYVSNATLYVPRASIEAYKTTSPWSGFGTIKAIEDVTGVKSVDAGGNSGSLPDGKYLRGGRLVIVKGGKEYDAAGAVK